MTRKTLSLFGIGLMALTILTAGLIDAPRAAAAQDVVKIGLSAPLTGDWAEYGNDFKRSVTMVIDRANRSRWLEEGSLTLGERANREVERLVSAWEPVGLPETTQTELIGLMEAEARRYGMDHLPERP